MGKKTNKPHTKHLFQNIFLFEPACGGIKSIFKYDKLKIIYPTSVGYNCINFYLK